MDNFYKTKIHIKNRISITGEPLPDYEQTERVEDCFVPLDDVQYYFDDTNNEFIDLKGDKTRIVFYSTTSIILMEDVLVFHEAKKARDRYLNKLKIQIKFN